MVITLYSSYGFCATATSKNVKNTHESMHSNLLDFCLRIHDFEHQITISYFLLYLTKILCISVILKLKGLI